MSPNDPLIRLLQSADAATSLPPVAAELPQRVRERRAVNAARSRRVAGALGIGAVLLASILVRDNAEPKVHRVPPGQQVISKVETDKLAELLAEANTLAAEADALQRQVDQLRVQHTLASNAARGWIAGIDDESVESPIDRAASIKICQGDFYWEVRQSSDSARAAYQSVLDNFPNSSWASVAREKLSRLSMN